MEFDNLIDNIILCADSYKVSHHKQYPPNTTLVYSYFESRGGKFEKTLFFGLQYILKKYLVGPVVTKEKILEAKELYKDHFGSNVFNEDNWTYILENHGGHLPVRIKAAPEGSVISTRNVLFSVENTDPKCFWLTNFLETLLVQVWYPMTVATNSWYQKELLKKHLLLTSDEQDAQSVLPFQLHDFGFRGCSSVESAGIGGCSHMVNFKGSDTIMALVFARKYYHCKMAGHSIPAAEHSTITTWGRLGEPAAFKNMLTAFGAGRVAVVSDSYNIFEACSEIWGTQLHELILENGKKGGVLVVRPDSGEPADIVQKVLSILGEKFGTTQNSKGFKMLPPFIRVIQGDGINYKSLGAILEAITAGGWSSANVIFGSGGALLQQLDRDTQKCAYKCSLAVIDGKSVEVYKDPITDVGKKSKKGRLKLIKRENAYFTIEQVTDSQPDDLLQVVFENGKLIKDFTLDEIRSFSDQFSAIL